MASVGHKRAWEVPVAITRPFATPRARPALHGLFHAARFLQPAGAPTAPLADVGALPDPSRPPKPARRMGGPGKAQPSRRSTLRASWSKVCFRGRPEIIFSF